MDDATRDQRTPVFLEISTIRSDMSAIHHLPEITFSAARAVHGLSLDGRLLTEPQSKLLCPRP